MTCMGDYDIKFPIFKIFVEENRCICINARLHSCIYTKVSNENVIEIFSSTWFSSKIFGPKTHIIEAKAIIASLLYDQLSHNSTLTHFTSDTTIILI